MKGIFVLEYDPEDAEEVSAGLISHHLIDSVKFVPTSLLEAIQAEAVGHDEYTKSTSTGIIMRARDGCMMEVFDVLFDGADDADTAT